MSTLQQGKAHASFIQLAAGLRAGLRAYVKYMFSPHDTSVTVKDDRAISHKPAEVSQGEMRKGELAGRSERAESLL